MAEGKAKGTKALVAHNRKRRGVKTPSKLTPQQELLLDCYFGKAEFCKAEAARMAGYTETVAKQAEQIFNRPAVRAEFTRRVERNRRRYEATYDRLVEELSSIAFANLADVMEMDGDGWMTAVNLRSVDMRVLAAIGEVTVETYFEGKGEEAQPIKRIRVKPWNKLQAIEMLMRHMGLSKDKLVVEHQVSVVDRLAAGRKRMRNRNISHGGPILDAEFTESRDSEEEEHEQACVD